MKQFTFAFLFMLGLIGQSFASDRIPETLMKEWETFRNQVDQIEAQGDVGGYMLYRNYGEMTLLWRTSNNESDNEVIRFFMQRTNGMVFAVTYHKSQVIVPGRLVLRRFVGTEPTGWVNHTIDFATLEYLGSQGQDPILTANEKKMMKEWGIESL